jgi:hypothetical protein
MEALAAAAAAREEEAETTTLEEEEGKEFTLPRDSAITGYLDEDEMQRASLKTHLPEVRLTSHLVTSQRERERGREEGGLYFFTSSHTSFPPLSFSV